MTEEEKAAKRANRMVLYVVHPAEMMNLRPSAYDSSSPFQVHGHDSLSGKGSRERGLLPGPGQRGQYNMHRAVMLIEYPLGDLLPKDFALSLGGTKYILHRHAMHR